MAKKKNWKRIDVSTVHESLVESNIAKSVARDGISDKIEIDIVGEAPSKKLAKKIKAQQAAGPLAARGAVEKAKLMKLVEKIKQKNERIEIDTDESDGRRKRESDDIWSEGTENFVKRRPKMPNLAKVIPAVAAPHAGQSYNPTPEAHAELIDQAVEALPKEELESDYPLTDLIEKALPTLEVEKLTFIQKQKLAHLVVQNNVSEETIMEVLQETPEEGGEEDPNDDEDEEESMPERRSRANRLNKKTRAQRNRIKQHRESMKQAQMRKRVKQLVHDIRSLKKDAITAEDTDANREGREERLRRYLEGLVKGKNVPRFGNKVYKADPPPVALSDEMKACLRQLQTPTKTPVDHVLDSIYRRGLVPAPPVIDEKYREHARLVVLVQEFAVHSEPKILPNDASALFTLRLKLLVFAPEVGELLSGTVVGSDSAGIEVSLGFFSDIKLISLFMPQNAAFDQDAKAWYVVENDTKRYCKSSTSVNFQVVEVTYNEMNGTVHA
ncbi:Nop53 [Babesia ovata]|uniref:Ribosome biogenesis protein NOP53 n=1 Tax=Babesia ovata TaxID=189622 RepID=A0A2H6K7P2_9APIC|nr:Nop53 [Babesia ovata]GBE59004.1 Nop53 [Babesia ovata]